MTIELTYGWRTRTRIVVVAAVTFAAGVVAATGGANPYVRVVAAVPFLLGAISMLDAVTLTSSWRMTSSALKVPTLVDRRREVSGRGDLEVSLHGRWTGAIHVEGPRGRRVVRVNPLVATRDLRRWFDAMADG